MKIGILLSRVRVEEKMLLSKLESLGVTYDRIDDGTTHFDINDPAPWLQYDAVLERSLSFVRGLYTTQ
jgi:[lysine-biosynthesis-protein LysW]---L-2-aminoadipate ligase